jgi:MYXO-CTERM domain-containing protein
MIGSWRAASVAVVLILLSATTASAYVRTLTCTEEDSLSDPLACREGESALPLFWPVSNGCVVLHANETGSEDISEQSSIHAIERSMESWTEVTCSYTELVYGGLTDEVRVGYDQCDGASNVNIIHFVRSGWTHQDGALALTSVTYDMRTGEIVDTDIELNDDQFEFTATNNPLLVHIDVRNTITHELGHVLGFDHTDDVEATMFPTAPERETSKRSLGQDDIDAICDTYPSGTVSVVCSDASLGYFEAPFDGPGSTCTADDGCGCSTAPESTSGWALGLSILGGLLLMRRRRLSEHL